MRLDTTAHLAQIVSVPPGYISLYLLLRSQQPQSISGAQMPAILQNPWFIASASAFMALLTLAAILSIAALVRKPRNDTAPTEVTVREAPSLVIEHAAYGLGGTSYHEVTTLLRAHIVGDRINVPVSNSTFDCDPFPGQRKHLAVIYVYKGKKERVVKSEGEQMVLPTPHHLLREKVTTLGRDLFAFLREKGPMPPNPTNHLRTTDSQWRTIRDAWDTYIEAIHHGYIRRFKARAVELFHELAENHINFNVEHYEIDPPQVAREASVRKIATECFFIAARLEIEDESQGV